MSAAPPRVLLIGRSALLGDSLAEVIQAGGMHVVASLSTTLAALDSIGHYEATFAVVEASSTLAETVALLRRIHRRAPLPLLVIGPPIANEELVELIEAGCCGYVDRDAGLSDLLSALRDAASRRTSSSPRLVALVAARIHSLAQSRAEDEPPASLTAREIEVLCLAAQGRSNKEIARELDVWLQTVKSHLHNIYEKLAVRNRREAVARAIRRGLIRTH